MIYIVINEEQRIYFDELKIESGIDFSEQDVTFLEYYDEFIMCEGEVNSELFKTFKEFLDTKIDFDSLERREITQQEIEDYWLSLEE